MLSRVVDLANKAASQFDNTNVLVTTEDERIQSHAKELGANCIVTPDNCKTGSDRVLAALKQMDEQPDFVINMQGDAPFTPVNVLSDIIRAHQENPQIKVITPIYQLNWNELDGLREAKKNTPFSGTTVTVNEDGTAMWFSKNIIPAIRDEDRGQSLSPAYQHIGLYGFRFDALEKFCALPQSHYEKLEGLEQLRLLENNIAIHTIRAEADALQSGIDTPEDLKRAEAFISKSAEKTGT